MTLLSQSEAEAIWRITFSQDTSDEAQKHRTEKAEIFHELQQVLITDATAFPEQFSNFAQNSGKIRFPEVENPNQRYSANLSTEDGKEWMAVVHLGICRPSDAEKIHKKLEKVFLGQNSKRLLVWFKHESGFRYCFDGKTAKITDNIARKPSNEIEPITR